MILSSSVSAATFRGLSPRVSLILSSPSLPYDLISSIM
jgi:hypothetical protein